MSDDLLELERRRCAAIAAGDVETLRELLSPRLVHVHTRGNRDSLESYLDYVTTTIEILEVRRFDLEVERYGDCAVMTGGQINVARPRGSDADPIEVESRVMQAPTPTPGRPRVAPARAWPIADPR